MVPFLSVHDLMSVSMDSSQTLTFPGRFEGLAAISEFVTRAAMDAGLDARAIYAVQLAVDEACSNIIEHAYGGEGRGNIECTCRVNDMGLTIILIEHFMKVITALSGRMMVLESGREICLGPPEEVTRDAKVIECYLGDSHA